MSSAGSEGAREQKTGEARSGPVRNPQFRNLRNWDGADWRLFGRQFSILLIGLFLFALALVMSLQSNLGANSWTVFHDGIAKQTPITIGQATILVGLVMLVVSWAFRIRPGLGTILNMILVGVFMDVILWSGTIDLAQHYAVRVTMLLGAVALLGLASGIYIMAGFGAGPRDSFNLAMTEATGLSISVTRWMLEGTVVVVGILLGGSFGIGTLIFMVLIGPSVGLGFRVCGLSTRPTRPTPTSQPAEIPPVDSLPRHRS